MVAGSLPIKVRFGKDALRAHAHHGVLASAVRTAYFDQRDRAFAVFFDNGRSALGDAADAFAARDEVGS